MTMRKLLVTVLILAPMLIAGCADKPRAPIVDRTRPAGVQPKPAVKQSSPDYGSDLQPGPAYWVKRGDTLYSIAFRLGMDYRELARINGITAPYTIHINQKLQTKAPPSKVARKPAAKPPVEKKPKPKPAPKTTITPTPKPSAKPTPKPVPKSSVKVEKPPAAEKKASPKPKVSEPISTAGAGLGPVSKWRWPTGGKVVRTYSSNVHKGVDITGKRGEAVRAVAGGVVVYAGTGVKGYGALLIIKHNEQYLSAYGHNDAILVREGQKISAGQHIANMGSTGTDTVKLHFEIRKNGKPIDPLKFLPSR